MPNPRIPCEFFLIRYVPDVVKGEFTNIGVLLREADSGSDSPASKPAVPRLRFTRDWTRVQCMHPDADTDMLESLEAEMLFRLETEAVVKGGYPRNIIETLDDSFSNSIQISESRFSLAENLTVELDQMMKLYVEPLRVGTVRQRSGRATIVASMRREFERAGVWKLMQKRIPAAPYTQTGDPMKLDCGYRPNGVIRIFHAVSLEHGVEAAKSLAFSASQLHEGLRRVATADLDLAAVVEPLRALSPISGPPGADDDFTVEDNELYEFGMKTMTSAGIRVLTTSNLAEAADSARVELRI